MSNTLAQNCHILSMMLRKAPLFAELPQESHDCFRLLQQGAVAHASAGEMLMQAGGRAFFLKVLDGRVLDERRGVIVRSPTFFGVDELMVGGRCRDTIRAVDEVTYYSVEASAFAKIMRECRLLARKLVAE